VKLSAEDGRRLLQAARRSIAAHLAGERPPREEPTPALRAPGGAFVTLRRREGGELRGCVGVMEAPAPLLETVARVAVMAASADGRFDPVPPGELAGLAVEVSVLGPLYEVRPEDVEVGRHGLLLRAGERHGVLLPQVALEQGWDRETFLDRACWKAGLPAGSWRQPGVQVLAFTAEVFSEE
jgi:AmmeMemoRadiSam system protein A